MTKSLALLNGRIYTDWYDNPVEALLIEDGLVIQSGSNQDILVQLRPNTQELDLAGKTVWPGLCDSHIHLEQLTYQLASINCEGLSKQEILLAVKEWAKYTPAGEWIIGNGFNQNDWQPPEYGTSRELDEVSPNHPVLIRAKSLHAAWANSQAMRLAGIHENSPDPEAGAFLRYADGSPNGILLEYAISEVSQHIPSPSSEQLEKALLDTQNYLHSFGITAVHDFDDLPLAHALLNLNATDKLRLRVTKNVRMESFERILTESWHEKLKAAPFISPGWLKLFADGALGPQSAAMLEPYENSGNRGMLLMSSEGMANIGLKAREHGWSLTIHAIGDLAARTCLDAVEAIQSQVSEGQTFARLPHRIEHIQALDPQDLPRFKDLNVIASIQPIHATSDYKMATQFWGKRCESAYAYKSLLDSGAMLILGTDAPVELPNPFHTLHAALTRQTLKGEPQPDGWYPAQKLSLVEALQGMTINPAKYYIDPAQTGTLKPGSNADFMVLTEDPFKMPAHRLYEIEPELTFVAGECVYSKA